MISPSFLTSPLPQGEPPNSDLHPMRVLLLLLLLLLLFLLPFLLLPPLFLPVENSAIL